MLKNKIKKMLSVIALGALLAVGTGSVRSMAISNAQPIAIEASTVTENSFENYGYDELIKEMLAGGYIDQAKADEFTKVVSTENGQMNICKTYDLYLIDLNVKEGYYSKEAGEIEKRLVEAEYAENYDLASDIYDEFMGQLEKEGVITEYDISYGYPNLVKEMLDAGYINETKASEFTKGIDSEEVQLEISKAYDLFCTEQFVKEGYYSREAGELAKKVIEAMYSNDYELFNQLHDQYIDQLEKEGAFSNVNSGFDYTDLIKDMLNNGYIDQAKADELTKGVGSETTQFEINNMYEFFIIDQSVKSGDISAEVGELNKQLIKAQLDENYELVDQIYDKLTAQLKM